MLPVTKGLLATIAALVDYGAGNLTSVVKAFEAVRRDRPHRVLARASSRALTPSSIPGVGHFAARPRRSMGAGDGVIAGAIAAGVPLLGICLGMQWLFEGSDEAPGRRGPGSVRRTVLPAHGAT